MLNILSMYEMSSVIADEKRLERYFASDEEELEERLRGIILDEFGE